MGENSWTFKVTKVQNRGIQGDMFSTSINEEVANYG